MMRKIVLLGASLVGMALIVSACTSGPGLETREELAQCVTDAGRIMYGADTCSACKAQKQLFGKSFERISYVECNDGGKQSEVCTLAGVEAYPTRISTAGERMQGVQTLEILAGAANCPFGADQGT